MSYVAASVRIRCAHRRAQCLRRSPLRACMAGGVPCRVALAASAARRWQGSAVRRTAETLRPRDLDESPVWEFTLGERTVLPNEGSVRPVASSKARDGTGVYLVRSTFVLADGTRATGYCTPRSAPAHHPDNPHLNFGYLAPAVLTEAGPVTFWSVAREQPDLTRLDEQYTRLGRTADEVFPLSFAADVEVGDDEVAAGTLTGFYCLVHLSHAGRRFELFEMLDATRVTNVPLIYP
jgi:hypothetical protein